MQSLAAAGGRRSPSSFFRTVLVFVGGAVSSLLLSRAYSYLFSRYRGNASGGDTRRQRWVAFGDSITQHGYQIEDGGWVAQLAAKYVRKIDIYNRGYSGFTTREGLQLLPGIIADVQDADVVMIFFGANDACIEGVPQHVPLSDFEDNLEQLILMIPRSTRILLVTPPPVDEEDLKKRNEERGKAITLDRRNENTKQYAQRVKSIGERLKISVLDIFTLFEDSPRRFLKDGLHLNQNGNSQLFNLLVAFIEKQGWVAPI